MDFLDVAVIGAGAVGLSVAKSLLELGFEVFVLEKNHRAGEEISSRNSEVLHSGVYYPLNSLKSLTCLKGNQLLRDYFIKKGISASLEGKLIVAVEEEEIKNLLDLKKNADTLGIPNYLLDPKEVNHLEPYVQCKKGLFIKTSGVFDSVAYIKALVQDVNELGGFIAYGSKVLRLEVQQHGWKILVEGEPEPLFARVVVNSAGLGAKFISEASGISVPKVYFCKGRYFSLKQKKASLFKRPIYPIPDKYGLGIHITPDVAGQVKLGPDTIYIDKIDYSITDEDHEVFFKSVKRFFPLLEWEDIAPAMSGIRPKLQGIGEGFKDFYIKMEQKGLINMIGIESPGLTSSLALGEYVAFMVKDFWADIFV